ncbi:flavin reductase family protein [Sulfitobacter aestuariivivens]|uniref:Flavin reductase family protein n=1 Tax=Sulfitobacter aestuariivivens TaxID=2766981 RepID=A0A927HGB4_9RHOB|nr:flavin reductase family protein [Sulfitobacter aestuariivivens]MBD3665333.1 flavin reductase family protein [Sulfitobacter aestuariivivens]
MSMSPKELRRAFGRFLTGVTVVTARAPNGEAVGFTANSFTSVSLDPPLLLVCPGNHLSSFDVFRETDRFGISVLAEGQEDISNLFASGSGDRFGATNWTAPKYNIPLITGRAAGFTCDLHERVVAGDHLILIGRVTHFDNAELPGLGYGPDGYFTQSSEREAEAPHAVATRASALLEDADHVLLNENLELPTVEVPPGQSPLQTLLNDLKSREIETALSVVYAVYDEAANRRRIVFRGTAKTPQPGLRPVDIQTLPYAPIADPALKSLLTRFAQEHQTKTFGLYVGGETEGDVLPTEER